MTYCMRESLSNERDLLVKVTTIEAENRSFC